MAGESAANKHTNKVQPPTPGSAGFQVLLHVSMCLFTLLLPICKLVPDWRQGCQKLFIYLFILKIGSSSLVKRASSAMCYSLTGV